MKYTSINIQGNLISEEILHKIEEADVHGQLAKDFGFEPGINLRNEIEYAWSRIKLDWKHFFDRTEKLPASDPYGTSLSRRWMTSFFSTLGFELNLQKTSLQGSNQQLYSISHTCDQLDGVPVHIVGFNDPSHPEKNTLDIRSSGGTSRLSPHATIQEYLNVTEHLYAMATNGLILRLVRDSGRLVKMTYIEFDLKRLLEDDKYSEFTLLYRLLHASRFPKLKQDAEQCFLEKYYQDSIESGNRIRDGLSDAVKESLVALGNGLLEHPENDELREKITSGRPDAREFYHQLLRLIYRLLFLMVTEERDLVFSELKEENKEPDMDDLLKGIKRPTKKQKEIYYNFYSLVRLRKLSQKRYLLESQYSDLWQGLMQAFALFESGGTGRKLGIQALGSELFSSNAMPDITSSKVNNRVLLKCIKSLNEFEDEKHNLSFINYRALDVEELGSVYEGLLELEPVFEWENGKPKFTFKKGSERSTSGSHYTPEDLVKPLIQHSLEYLIEDRVTDFYKGKSNEAETIKKLLELKICDIACGSGHILLSAARRIALEVARVETGEQQPNPASFRHALKEVIKNCIYGVDKNPLAAELCKVALWLESHNPGEPLSFLDHRIKCGDAIVGLALKEELQKGIADEAFKKLPGDDKEIASAFLKKNRQERILREKSGQVVQLTTEADHKLMVQVKELNRLIENFSTLPENTPEEIEKKEKAYRILINSDNLKRLKILANLQIMPFFLPKTENSKEFLVTDTQFHRYLRGESRIPSSQEIKAIEIATTYRFFHWFLEFPEVFNQGGFDCILGNPPYLGNVELNRSTSSNYVNQIKAEFKGIKDKADLVTYFVRRTYGIINKRGFIALITTNSITQGDTRIGSLDQLLSEGGRILFGIKSIKWQGKANVWVSIFSITKDLSYSQCFLGNRKVSNINSRLEILVGENQVQDPYTLKINMNICFRGSMPSSNGFFIDKEFFNSLPNDEKLFVQRIISGEELYNDYNFERYRLIINLNEVDEQFIPTQLKTYLGNLKSGRKIKYEIALQNNKETQRLKNLYNNYWKFEYHPSEVYLTNNDKIIALTRVSKSHAPRFIVKSILVTDSIVLFNTENYSFYSIIQSELHSNWAWYYCSTLKADRRYTPTDGFETFPLPNIQYKSGIEKRLESIGNEYHTHRENLLYSIKLGLTKTYNYFHTKDINVDLIGKNLQGLNKKTNVNIYSNEVWNLWNHLQKKENTISFDEAIRGIIKLRELQVKLDNVVLEAYEWQDIDFKHNYYEVDYLPENDRVRFTIHPDARKEVLKRLLELNHKIHEEEVKAGLWDKKTGTKKSEKIKSIEDQVNEPEVGYGELFD